MIFLQKDLDKTNGRMELLISIPVLERTTKRIDFSLKTSSNTCSKPV